MRHQVREAVTVDILQVLGVGDRIGQVVSRGGANISTTVLGESQSGNVNPGNVQVGPAQDGYGKLPLLPGLMGFLLLPGLMSMVRSFLLSHTSPTPSPSKSSWPVLASN